MQPARLLVTGVKWEQVSRGLLLPTSGPSKMHKDSKATVSSQPLLTQCVHCLSSFPSARGSSHSDGRVRPGLLYPAVFH